MIDAAGLVKIVDFGLARLYTAAPDGRVPMTAVLGLSRNPFLAPELRTERIATVRSDLFAFCRALQRALRIDESSAKFLRGTPSWLLAALEKGTRTEPEARWKDLATMLAYLQARRRRGVVVASSLGFLAVGTAIGAVAAYSTSAQTVACAAEAAAIDVVWSQDRRASLRDRFPGDTGGRLLDAIDAEQAEYREVAVGLCVRTRQEQDGARLAQQQHCLDRVASRIDLLYEVAREDTSLSAQDLLMALFAGPRPKQCEFARTDVRDDLGSVNVSAQSRLRRALERAQLQEDLRRRKEAGAIVDGVLPEIRRIENLPLLAQALTIKGTSMVWQEKNREAQRVLREAFSAAFRSSADEVAIESAAMLVFVTGFKLLEYERALEYADQAEALIERASLPPWFTGRVLIERARIYRRLHDIEGTLRTSTAAVDALTESNGEKAYHTMKPLTGIGLMQLYNVGDLDAAEVAFKQLKDVALGHFGPGHPYEAVALGYLGVIAGERGDWGAGIDLIAHSVDMFGDHLASRDYGPLANWNLLGWAFHRTGDLTEAERAYEDCIALNEYFFFPITTYLSESLTGLGQINLDRGDHAVAVEQLEEALWLREANPALDLPHERPEIRLALGMALWGAGREFGRALALIRAAEYELRHPREPCARCPRLQAELAAWSASNPAAAMLSTPHEASTEERLNAWGDRDLRPRTGPDGML